MQKKTLAKLEYNKITDLLADQASSFGGKQQCKKLKPMTSLSEINTAQAETEAAFSLIVKKGRPNFDGNQPVGESLKRLEIGGDLGAGELLRIGRLLECAAQVKSYGKHEAAEDAADCLDPYFNDLNPLPQLFAEISRCILGENEQGEAQISDEASPTLKHIRQSIGRQDEKIHTTLNSMINGSARAWLQDPLITLRGDRYCLPVKAEYKAQVPGLIHDQSASGSTLFIEPAAVVRINNDLQELYGQEQAEIRKILASLSARAAEETDALRADARTLTRLDFLFAKGALALSMNATRPQMNEDRYIHIRNGRHPLLDPETVVPISVELGGDFDLLIVTGPNTGGKTVSLKTVGLLTLMGQAGLFIPAGEHSELGVFTNVFADIGDEQSIEQSLSTFSAHMTNIVSFLKQADENSLMLFDELGAGTDPAEGAALAASVLSFLHERGIRTMATTHYSELKAYALTTPGVENACCEFDVDSLKPTYHLLLGVPGKSNAFAIAGKLGLSGEIIEDARERMTRQETSLEDLLGDLEESRHSLEEEQAQVTAYRQELETLQQEAQKTQKDAEDERDKILQEANEQALKILTDAKETADATIRDFRKFGKENVSASEMEKERDTLRRKMDKAQEGAHPVRKQKKAYKASDFKLGESVKVLSMNLTGTVISKPDSRGMVQVQMGILKSKVPVTDLEIIEDTPSYSVGTDREKKSRAGGGKIKMDKSLSVSPELNLLGKTVDEAVSELDKYLDDAVLAHLDSVRIVHGKGTGALRAGVQDYLRRQPHVASFRLGNPGEGDSGVTIVELK